MKNVYVQGDWTAAPASGARQDAALVANYARFLDAVSASGMRNLATWHHAAVGVHVHEPSTDVLRNTREVDECQGVVVYLQRDDPCTKHWSSVATLAYAVGRGKPCYVLAPRTCVIWQNHFLYHPLIQRRFAEEVSQDDFCALIPWL